MKKVKGSNRSSVKVDRSCGEVVVELKEWHQLGTNMAGCEERAVKQVSDLRKLCQSLGYRLAKMA